MAKGASVILVRDAPRPSRGQIIATALVAAAIASLGFALAIVTLAIVHSKVPPSDEPSGPRVSQRDEQFHPGTLAIRRGETVRVVNDDGALRHHAYVDSPRFKFDSGDQEPGQHSDIRFAVAGHFVVLCGIHPRMRLEVDVQ